MVEDDRATRTFLADNLSADGYELLTAGSIREAERLLGGSYPDLVVLDLSLPDADGLELVDRIRGADSRLSRIDPALPLLILSGRSAELDRLRGLQRGADDYVVKPFSYQELRLRIEALLRRTRLRPRQGRLRAGTIELDPVSRTVWVAGQVVNLSNKEFALLRVLAAEPTRVFTREELLRGVWGFKDIGRTRTLDSHASRLRQKLSHTGDRYVVNVWGIGYRLADGGL